MVTISFDTEKLSGKRYFILPSIMLDNSEKKTVSLGLAWLKHIFVITIKW